MFNQVPCQHLDQMFSKVNFSEVYEQAEYERGDYALKLEGNIEAKYIKR